MAREEDAATESCNSRAAEATAPALQAPRQQQQQQQQRYKLEVYNQVLRRLREANVAEALSPSFDDKLWAHFNRLPARYAMDVNVERAEDVLTHKRLLEEARDPSNRPVFSVRVVQVSPIQDGNQADSVNSHTAGKEVASSYFSRHRPDLFSSLAQQLQSADVLASHRVFMVLYRALKELSTKRLASDQRSFSEYNKEALQLSELALKQTKPQTEYFCKTLTASDTSTHGGFSVPRRAAEKIFPFLDFSMQPPALELQARDLHDSLWTFRHIY